MLMMKSRKFQSREAIGKARRRQLLRAARWTLLLLFLGTSFRLGADRVSHVAFLPIRGLRANIPTGSMAELMSGYWKNILTREIESAQKGKNRLTFTLKAHFLKKKIMAKNPFVSDIDVAWGRFLLKGDLNVSFRFRKPIAFRREGASTVCLDASLVSFPCPSEIAGQPLQARSLKLVEVSDLNGDFLKLALQAFPAVNQALLNGCRVIRLEGRDNATAVFQSGDGKRYLLSRNTLTSNAGLERSLDKLKSVLLDLQARKEDFNEIDLALVSESNGDRIVAALKPQPVLDLKLSSAK